MLYIINFDVKDLERKETFLSKVKDLGDNILYAPNSLFLTYSENEKDKIYRQLRQSLSDEDLLLVSQITNNEISGWLKSSAIKWLKLYQYVK